MVRRAFSFVGAFHRDFSTGFSAGSRFFGKAMDTYDSLGKTLDVFGSVFGYVRERNRIVETYKQIASLMHALDEQEQAARAQVQIEVEEWKQRLELAFRQEKAEVEAKCQKLRDQVRLQTEKLGARADAYDQQEQMHRAIRKDILDRLERLEQQILLISRDKHNRYLDDLNERFRTTMRHYKELVDICAEIEGEE